MKIYRNNGAIGAILDEYEKTIFELQEVLRSINLEELIKVVDEQTKDPACISIQSILNHVVQSGYTYVLEIRKSLGEEIEYRTAIKFDTIAAYEIALKQMFQFNEKLFEDYPNMVLAEYDSNKKILVRWGQRYDVEQLLEHAIVHILRHRRQIERFLVRLRMT